MTPAKLYIIDGSGYIFRAYYAIQRLTTRDGFPTNALYGFTRMLLKLLHDCESQHIVMVFDAGRETFRNEMYAEYKANRQECPEDLSKQMPYFRELARALGIRILEQKGYEADDLIATLVKRFSPLESEVVVVTADKDLMQLVTDKVTIWDTMRDQRYSRAEVRAKFGVDPERVVELLGLMGDTSDNIPGLKGVGPKTAAQLIEKYGDVETVLRSAAEIAQEKSIRNRQKISAQIESDADLLRLSRKLVELKDDTPIEITDGGTALQLAEVVDEKLHDLTLRSSVNTSDWSALVDRFEFHSLLKEFNGKILAGEAARENVRDSARYITVYDSEFGAWVEKFRAQKEFVFDLETTSLDPHAAKVVGASFCWSEDEAYYIPIAHRIAIEQQGDKRSSEQVSFDRFIRECGPQLFSSKGLCGQNLKYDISVLAAKGETIRGASFDTMIAAYLLSPERGSFSLGSLARGYLGVTMIEYDEVAKDLEDFSFVSIEKATEYSCEDAHVAWLLRQKLIPLLEEQGLLQVFHEIEVPLVPILADMEVTGIKLDVEMLKGMSEQLGSKIDGLQKKIFELAGGEFNINSPKQLAEILFQKLAIPTKGLRKTKTGVSTDSDTLEKLSADYPLPAVILEYRGLHKLKSTYVDALPAQVSPITGRLHSRFNQTVTATGRLSSSDPNLQNIPIRTAEGRKVREAFIAEPGKVILSADYSQIELRLLAHMSADENLCNAFQRGEDIHAATAREIMGLAPDAEVTDELRRLGKTLNFGIIYGMSGFRLGRELGMPVSEANQYIENYFNRYPGVKTFFAELEKRVEAKEPVHTMFGRKRFVTEIDPSGRDRGFVRRASLNAPLQGTAADIIKLAMVKIDTRILKLCQDRGYGASWKERPIRLMLQIHDELVFECLDSFREEGVALVREEMEHVADLRVPLKVDVRWGHNWQEAH